MLLFGIFNFTSEDRLYQQNIFGFVLKLLDLLF